jgi:hypothetical protein
MEKLDMATTWLRCFAYRPGHDRPASAQIGQGHLHRRSRTKSGMPWKDSIPMWICRQKRRHLRLQIGVSIAVAID